MQTNQNYAKKQQKQKQNKLCFSSYIICAFYIPSLIFFNEYVLIHALSSLTITRMHLHGTVTEKHTLIKRHAFVYISVEHFYSLPQSFSMSLFSTYYFFSIQSFQ